MSDKLGMLAGAVVAQVRPRISERQDCYQTAYLAGLQALRSAAGRPTSSTILFYAMRTAVYRFLCKPAPITEADIGYEVMHTV